MSTENMAPATEANTNAVVNEAPAQEQQNEQPQEAQIQEPVETVESVRKKAENRISRLEKARAKRDWQLSEQAKQVEALNRQIEELRKASQPKAKEPNSDEFDNYGDYLKALAQYRPDAQEKPEAVDPQKIQEQAFTQAKEQIHYQSRIEHMDKQAAKAMQEIPGYGDLVDQYEDVIDAAPQEIVRAFLDAENGHLAFYALASEGKLEQLAMMNPIQAAMEIARAEMRGAQLAQSKKVSKAPNPIAGARGNASGVKGLPDLKSVDEVMKWVRS